MDKYLEEGELSRAELDGGVWHGGTWWEVGVPEVSTLDSVTAADYTMVQDHHRLVMIYPEPAEFSQWQPEVAIAACSSGAGRFGRAASRCCTVLFLLMDAAVRTGAARRWTSVAATRAYGSDDHGTARAPPINVGTSGGACGPARERFRSAGAGALHAPFPGAS